MGDSTENLDDGELYLPSDILPLEDFSVSDKPSCCFYSSLHRHHSFMAEQGGGGEENITQRFAAFSLLHQRNHIVSKHFPITERFRPDSAFYGCIEHNGGGLVRSPSFHGYGTAGFRPGLPPKRFCIPVQHQVESLMEARGRVLQMEENRFIRMRTMARNLDRFVGNRFLPFVGSGYGGGGCSNGGGGSSERNYGGTGVFLPQVPTNINKSAKKQGGRNNQDVQHIGQSNLCNKQEEWQGLIPREKMSLPKDWSY